MGERTVRNFDFLYSLSQKKSPKTRWNMVQKANRDQLLSIIDVCANVLHKDFRLTAAQDKKLEKYWEFMRKLSKVRSEKGARKAIQRGEGIVYNPRARRKRDKVRLARTQEGRGFLPAILLPVVSTIAKMGADYIWDKISSSKPD